MSLFAEFYSTLPRSLKDILKGVLDDIEEEGTKIKTLNDRIDALNTKIKNANNRHDSHTDMIKDVEMVMVEVDKFSKNGNTEIGLLLKEAMRSRKENLMEMRKKHSTITDEEKRDDLETIRTRIMQRYNLAQKFKEQIGKIENGR